MSGNPGGSCKKHKRTNFTYKNTGRMYVNKCKTIMRTLRLHPNDTQLRKRLDAADLAGYYNQAKRELIASGFRMSSFL